MQRNGVVTTGGDALRMVGGKGRKIISVDLYYSWKERTRYKTLPFS